MQKILITLRSLYYGCLLMSLKSTVQWSGRVWLIKHEHLNLDHLLLKLIWYVSISCGISQKTPMDDRIQELRKHVPNISSLRINLSSLLKLYNFWKVITKTWKIFQDHLMKYKKKYNINIKCLSPWICTWINTDFWPHWLGWLENVDSLKLWTDVFINKGDLSLLVPFIKYFVEFLILWQREPVPPITNLTCNKITITTSQVKQFIQYKVFLLNITTVKNWVTCITGTAMLMVFL